MIGTRLKSLRRERHLNQKEVAAIIGVTKAMVSHYETGKDNPSDNIKIKIARLFNVSLDYLLGVIDEPVPFYSEEVFLRFPYEMQTDELLLLKEFVSYLEHRKSIYILPVKDAPSP